jgi:hypothetical protein
MANNLPGYLPTEQNQLPWLERLWRWGRGVETRLTEVASVAASAPNSIYATYHDSPLTAAPNIPTGSGDADGWHRSQTAASVWMSQKQATSVELGEWGEPTPLRGASTGFISGTDGTVFQQVGGQTFPAEITLEPTLDGAGKWETRPPGGEWQTISTWPESVEVEMLTDLEPPDVKAGIPGWQYAPSGPSYFDGSRYLVGPEIGAFEPGSLEFDIQLPDVPWESDFNYLFGVSQYNQWYYEAPGSLYNSAGTDYFRGFFNAVYSNGLTGDFLGFNFCFMHSVFNREAKFAESGYEGAYTNPENFFQQGERVKIKITWSWDHRLVDMAPPLEEYHGYWFLVGTYSVNGVVKFSGDLSNVDGDSKQEFAGPVYVAGCNRLPSIDYPGRDEFVGPDNLLTGCNLFSFSLNGWTWDSGVQESTPCPSFPLPPLRSDMIYDLHFVASDFPHAVPYPSSTDNQRNLLLGLILGFTGTELTEPFYNPQCSEIAHVPSGPDHDMVEITSLEEGLARYHVRFCPPDDFKNPALFINFRYKTGFIGGLSLTYKTNVSKTLTIRPGQVDPWLLARSTITDAAGQISINEQTVSKITAGGYLDYIWTRSTDPLGPDIPPAESLPDGWYAKPADAAALPGLLWFTVGYRDTNGVLDSVGWGVPVQSEGDTGSRGAAGTSSILRLSRQVALDLSPAQQSSVTTVTVPAYTVPAGQQIVSVDYCATGLVTTAESDATITESLLGALHTGSGPADIDFWSGDHAVYERSFTITADKGADASKELHATLMIQAYITIESTDEATE